MKLTEDTKRATPSCPLVNPRRPQCSFAWIVFPGPKSDFMLRHVSRCGCKRSAAASLKVVLAQQRYAKSHRILANCRSVKDFGDSRTPETGLGLVGQFWGLDSDRILKLVLREIILSQEIQMPPGGRRAIQGLREGRCDQTQQRLLIEPETTHTASD